MNTSLLLFGLAKAAFGIVLGAFGIFLAARILHRLLGSGATETALEENNLGMGVFKAGSIVAVGILFRAPVNATFGAMDLLYNGRGLGRTALRAFSTYAALHFAVSTVVAAFVLAAGGLLFTKLTRGVDEMKAIREGKVAPAMMLAAVLIVLALLTAPGLQTALDGLLPLPTMGRDVGVEPA